MRTVLWIVAVSLLLAATASEAGEVRPRNSLHGAIVFGQPKPAIVFGQPKPVVRFKRCDKDQPRTVTKTGERSC